MMPPIFKKCLQVNRFSKFWQVHLSKLRFFNFFDNDPIRLDGDGRLALLDLHRTIILSTFLLLLPLANLTLPLPMNKNIQLISDQQKHEQKVKKKKFFSRIFESKSPGRKWQIEIWQVSNPGSFERENHHNKSNLEIIKIYWIWKANTVGIRKQDVSGCQMVKSRLVVK